MTTILEQPACQRVSFHNACRLRQGIDPTAAWCFDHQVPVYRDGIDWNTDTDRLDIVVVLDATRERQMPVGKVTVAAADMAGFTDRELAEAAGYDTRHFGFDVTRWNEGTALVRLYND